MKCLLVDTPVRPDPSAVSWVNPRLDPGEERRVVTGIPGKTGVVYTLDRETGEFLWATPTIVQNVISGINGATGAVSENAELVFTAQGQTVLACPHASGGKDWESVYRSQGRIPDFPEQCVGKDGVFLAVVRRRDRHRRAPGRANVDGLQAVAPHPPGQVAHEGARRIANRGGAHRALQHGGEEGAEELVRDGPQLLFALLRFLCRPGRWSTRLKLQRPPEGSAQVWTGMLRRSISRLGVSMALLSISTHHHGQSEP